MKLNNYWYEALVTVMVLFSISVSSETVHFKGQRIELTAVKQLSDQAVRYQSADQNMKITQVGDAIYGHLIDGESRYAVSGTLAAPLFKPNHGVLGNDMEGMALPTRQQQQQIMSKFRQSASQQEAAVVDVIIWVDELFLPELGMDGTRALAWDKVALTNEVLVNSGIEITIRPILMETVAMPEHDGTIDHLSTGFFLNPHNNSAARVKMRDDWGTDLVHVIKKLDDDDGACGRVSYSMDFDEWLVIGVSAIGSGCPIETFVHEVGHTLHAFHERESYDPNPDNPYWYGYACGGGASIMHTQWGIYTRQHFFSSPNHEYNGVKCGVAIGEEGHADNTQAIKDSAAWRASLRDQPSVLTSASFSVSASTVEESAESVTVTVTLAEAVDSETSVEVFVQTGTATSDVDYTGIAQRVVFAAGDTQKSIVVGIVDDTEYESTEQFNITLQWPFRLTLTGDTTQTVSITDNDVNSGTVALSTASASVSENQSSVAVTVTRSGGSDGSLTAHVTTEDGTAVSGVDYTGLDQDVVFAERETSQTVSIVILGDTQQVDRSFDLILSGTQAEGVMRTTVTIEDVPEVVTPPPPPAEEKSSGGGSMGALMMCLLGVTLWRRRMV
jgi:copper chaperone CopZ